MRKPKRAENISLAESEEGFNFTQEKQDVVASMNSSCNGLNRRGFLRGGVALVAAASVQFFKGIPALADYAVGPTVRRNASLMSANDPILRGYRRAIKAMRALPDVNPCSWFYQAAIHGTTDPRNLTAWNTCHTDPDFFWGLAPHVPVLVRADCPKARQHVRLGHPLLGLGQSVGARHACAVQNGGRHAL